MSGNIVPAPGALSSSDGSATGLPARPVVEDAIAEARRRISGESSTSGGLEEDCSLGVDPRLLQLRDTYKGCLTYLSGITLKRKTGHSDTTGTQRYRRALEEADGAVESLLDLACGDPVADVIKCRDQYRYVRQKCDRYEQEREKFLAQWAEDRRELSLL